MRENKFFMILFIHIYDDLIGVNLLKVRKRKNSKT